MLRVQAVGDARQQFRARAGLRRLAGKDDNRAGQFAVFVQGRAGIGHVDACSVAPPEGLVGAALLGPRAQRGRDRTGVGRIRRAIGLRMMHGLMVGATDEFRRVPAEHVRRRGIDVRDDAATVQRMNRHARGIQHAMGLIAMHGRLRAQQFQITGPQHSFELRPRGWRRQGLWPLVRAGVR